MKRKGLIGIKIRGAFSTYENTKKHLKVLIKTLILVFVGEMGNMCFHIILIQIQLKKAKMETKMFGSPAVFQLRKGGDVFFSLVSQEKLRVSCVFLVGGIMFAFDDAWS